jgi:hypothetical protein
VVVCLIAGLTATSLHGEVFTVLDQCRQKGTVIVNGHPLAGEGTDTVSNVRWIRHGCFVYLPFAPSRVAVFRDTVSGSWSSVNTGESDSLVRDSVFMPVLLHGKDPRNAASGYALAYASTPAAAAGLAAHPTWTVLRNDTLCQAAAFSDGTLSAAFFGAGRLKLPDGHWLTVSRSCLLLWSEGALYASDPSHSGGRITTRLGGRKIFGTLPADGTTVRLAFGVQE